MDQERVFVLLFCVLAYLIGSIPFGLILGKLAGIGDLRTQGSGNIGATNMARVGGKKLAALTFLLDAGKGFLPLWFLLGPEVSPFALIVGFLTVLGHVFPVWLKFKGGKGVATTLGVLMVWPELGSVFAVVWLIVFIVSKISSLSALCAMSACLIYSGIVNTLEGLLFMLPFWLLLVFTHRANIRRLINGTEHRFGSKP